MLPVDLNRKAAFRTRHSTFIGYLVQQVVFLSVGAGQGSRILATKPLFAKMVEAEVSHNAVNPRVKRALETEAWQFQKSAQESFLIDILTVLGRTGKMNRDAENRSVVLIDELFESRSIALVCGSNQLRVIHARKIGFGGREHGDQASNSIHVATLATSFVRLMQHVGSIRLFSACPFPDRQAGARSSARYRHPDVRSLRSSRR